MLEALQWCYLFILQFGLETICHISINIDYRDLINASIQRSHNYIIKPHIPESYHTTFQLHLPNWRIHCWRIFSPRILRNTRSRLFTAFMAALMMIRKIKKQPSASPWKTLTQWIFIPEWLESDSLKWLFQCVVLQCHKFPRIQNSGEWGTRERCNQTAG